MRKKTVASKGSVATVADGSSVGVGCDCGTVVRGQSETVTVVGGCVVELTKVCSEGVGVDGGVAVWHRAVNGGGGGLAVVLFAVFPLFEHGSGRFERFLQLLLRCRSSTGLRGATHAGASCSSSSSSSSSSNSSSSSSSSRCMGQWGGACTGCLLAWCVCGQWLGGEWVGVLGLWCRL